MANPLSLLPIALAARGGRVDGAPAAGLVAAGFSLLQRSAPLVRALAGRRSAILLPPSGAVITALAASDGRGAVLLAPGADGAANDQAMGEGDIGALFTTRGLATQVPAGDHAVVLLDEAPHRATVRAQHAEATIDLGSHFGLDLEGEEDDGSDEECVVAGALGHDAPMRAAAFSHRNLLALARGAVDATSLQERDHVLCVLPPADLGGFALTMAGPLLAGARVTTVASFDAHDVLGLVGHDAITAMAGSSDMYRAMLDALVAHGTTLGAPALRVCVVLAAHVDAALQAAWLARTGTELRQAFGVAEAPLSLFNAPHFPNRPGTLGVPFPGVQVLVREAASGARLPVGAEGVLSVRGAQVATPSTTAGGGTARPLRDGWLDTRFVARERADGAFELVGDSAGG